MRKEDVMKITGKMINLLFGVGMILFSASLLYFPFVPSALAVTLTPGDLIVADFNGAFGSHSGNSPLGSGRILKVDPITGAQTMISSGSFLDAPYDVGIDAAGNIVVLDKAHPDEGASTTGQIIKVNPADGNQTVISQDDLFVKPMGLAIDASGNIILADQTYGGTGGIIMIDPTTGAQTAIATGGFINSPSDVTIDGDGNLYVTSGVSGGGLVVVKVDPTTGGQTLIYSETFNVWFSGIVVDDTTSTVYVNEIYYNNGIIQIDTDTGAQTFLSSGSPFQDPYNLDIDLAGNLVVADTNWFGEGKIIRIDPVSGVPTVVSSGGLLVDPAGIAVFEEVPVGSISGNVTTSVAGQTTNVVGASITVIGTGKSTSSDHEGNFTLSDIPVGEYTVKIEMTGFEIISLSNIQIT